LKQFFPTDVLSAIEPQPYGLRLFFCVSGRFCDADEKSGERNLRNFGIAHTFSNKHLGANLSH
jgi:hypothetical protein